MSFYQELETLMNSWYTFLEILFWCNLVKGICMQTTESCLCLSSSVVYSINMTCNKFPLEIKHVFSIFIKICYKASFHRNALKFLILPIMFLLPCIRGLYFSLKNSFKIWTRASFIHFWPRKVLFILYSIG